MIGDMTQPCGATSVTQSADYDAPLSEDVLDREGVWEIRVTIYRNGKRVATCDTTAHDTFDHAAYWAGEGLSTREVEMHRPRRRARVIPPEESAR